MHALRAILLGRFRPGHLALRLRLHAAVLSGLHRARRGRRVLRLRRLVLSFLLHLRKSVLEERRGFLRARLLHHPAVVLAQILRRRFRGPLILRLAQADHLAAGLVGRLRLGLLEGWRKLWPQVRRGLAGRRSRSGRAALRLLDLAAWRGDQADGSATRLRRDVEHRVLRDEGQEEEMQSQRHRQRNCEAAAPPDRPVRQRGHAEAIVTPRWPCGSSTFDAVSTRRARAPPWRWASARFLWRGERHPGLQPFALAGASSHSGAGIAGHEKFAGAGKIAGEAKPRRRSGPAIGGNEPAIF